MGACVWGWAYVQGVWSYWLYCPPPSSLETGSPTEQRARLAAWKPQQSSGVHSHPPPAPRTKVTSVQVSSPLACSASPLTPTEPSPGSWDSYFDPLSGFHLGKVNFTFRATILQNDLIWEWELPRAWAHKRLKVKTNLSCLGRLSRETKKITIFNLCVRTRMQRCVLVW